MNITYTYDDAVSVEEFQDLLARMLQYDGDRFPAANVFHVPLRDSVKEQSSLDHTIAVTARDAANNLVGFLKVLTDDAYLYYIYNVMVDPKLRKKGIGSRIVEMAVEECKKGGFMKIFLTAIPGTEEFYRKYGFKEGMSPVLTIRGEDYV